MITNKDFSIEIENFCSYKLDEYSVRKTALFLISQGRDKSITELYSDFIIRQKSRLTLENRLPDYDKWRSDGFATAPLLHEMIKHLYSIPDIINDGHKINWYNFPHYEGFNFHPGVIVNQYFLLNYDIDSHQEMFRYIFAIILTLTDFKEKFLFHHLKETFNSDNKRYKRFLKLAVLDNNEISNTPKEFTKQWIEDELKDDFIISDNRKSNPAEDQLDKARFHFYYYCLHSAGLDLWEDGEKMKHLHTIADRHGISKNSFYNKYKKIENGEERPKQKDIDLIKEMLKEKPQALKIFMDKFM